MKCYLCKKNYFEKIYSLKTKNIVRCKHDGLYLAQKTAEEKIYGEKYYLNQPNRFNRQYFLNKLNLIQHLTSNLPTSSRSIGLRGASKPLTSNSALRLLSGQYQNFKPKILDIGCGWGNFEEVLEAEKIPYLGIDINREAVKICQKKGLNCIESSLEQLINSKNQPTRYKQTSIIKNSKSKQFNGLKFKNWDLFGELGNWKLEFDCITLFQVIEHVHNPLPLLKSTRHLMKKGGVLLITTPNLNSLLHAILRSRWNAYSEPSHYLFFDSKTLRKTLEIAGFDRIEVKIDDMRYLSLNYILNRLNISTSNILHLTSNIPIPTDPTGDLLAIVRN